MLKRRQEIDNTQLREQTNLIWLSVDIRHAHASRFIDKSLFIKCKFLIFVITTWDI